MTKSNSSLASISLPEKLRYYLALLRLQLARRRSIDFTWLADSLSEYDSYALQYTAKSLSQCRVLEIGFGARPFRLMFLISRMINAYGVDLDVPLIKLSVADLVRIASRNGLERAAKSLARWVVVQRKEYEAFGRYCAEQSGNTVRDFDDVVRMAKGRLIAIDAGDAAFWQRFSEPFDFIYSEDVFEHLPEETLEKVLLMMSRYMADGGIALIRPNIFTGITGGHQIEWSRHKLKEPGPRRSPPWDHLRQDLYPANTFLNRMQRKDYRARFSKYFEIVVEATVQPDLGREFMTPEIRQELANYPDEELFSNKVLFVLRKK